MAGIKDQENIDELRRRLYERGNDDLHTERHDLTPKAVDVSRGWDTIGDMRVKHGEPADFEVSGEGSPSPDQVVDEEAAITPPVKIKRRYRLFILIASLIFFIVTASVSSVYLFFGANQISAKNISLSLSVPFATAAGEVLSMQVSVSNQNSVAIDSATLIINYPSGTRAPEEGKDLYEERIPIENIAPGEALNIPIRAVFFGEEAENKEIRASIEYRVAGSNGTFYKEADPQQVQISSSPVVLKVTGLNTISSGQELELKIELKSNSQAVQKNILVNASYPNSFTFSKSDPEPTHGRNGWLIQELAPGSSVVLKVTGNIVGQANENSEIQIKVGNAQVSNQSTIGSVLSQTKFSYKIEKPFTNVSVSIAGDSDGLSILSPDEEAAVVVSVTNTLDETIYDMRVDIEPKGNLIRDDKLVIDRGFYDSATKRIRFEVSGDSSLSEVKPGETRTFSFMVKPDRNQSTASFSVSANVYARRVNEASATETLIGTTIAEAKYSSDIFLGNQLGYSDGPFTDTGPVPPVADTETTYTVTLVAGSGVNDISGAYITTSLPQYVSWLDKTEGDGKVEFEPTSKQLRWNIGEISALKTKTLKFQVSMKPSVTQVGRGAVVIGKQEMRATDKFTNVPLRISQDQLSNELSTELGFISGNGTIQARQ